MGAVCITHPLDLLKVHLQTQTKGNGLLKLAKSTVKHNGVRSLYSGLSASLARQATYSTVRFGTYDLLKNNFTEEGKVPSFPMKLLYAGVGGVFGAFAGNPCDVVNVRMQDDVRIAEAGRRNYRNIFHGVYEIRRTEGVGRLWRGVGANCSRAILMNIGQVAFYNQAKQFLLRQGIINDNMYGHLLSSAIAGTAATVITQPFDVLKTRMMQSNKYKNLLSCGMDTAKEGGPKALFKGFVPAWLRLLPQTILTFVFLEQLRKAFPLPQKPPTQY